MRPLAEFVVLSTLAGGVAMVFSTAIDIAGQPTPWTDSLKWGLPALAAAGIGAWSAALWQRRRAERAPAQRAGGMALRAVVLSALGYLPALLLYLLAALAITDDAAVIRSEMMLLLFVIGCLPLLWAAVPFSMIEYVLCRRYLRRVRVPAGSP
ncbi:hypothetical protein WMO33_14650 [Xanthomonas oryzae pv. oryzicola]|uniref:hypothetical protein n=1 Tax=Xanthomonas oryzae TaxID=347 RepID=UPI000642CF18|nr:hypothetical protein [Xanthomonas oryzae]AKK63430.1 membrane protein [Xanthomonas oryzae pv. oryzicola]AKO01438.1 membrane protein [Xanthomonas oryzae pv. oryzicola]KOR48148.1 hypothetical protein ADT27_07730 [Xanthomonas oryzae]OLK88315.1 membrane protein [Xanthomonas oryzae pv. oryzicola]QGH66803.1 hypothetical protein GHV42_15305 [Xanthomonas oryzae pv. oryzicola]